MDTGIIKKPDIKEVIRSLMQIGQVVAPVRQEDLIMFSLIQSADEAYLDYTNTKQSPKGCFFPQTEVLFYYEKRDHKIDLPPNRDKSPGFLLGVRPCDARALTLLDPVFDDSEYKDVLYLNKRSKWIIIGLACKNPQKSCFCTATGGGPADTAGMDLLLQDLGDRYLIKGVTEQGKEILTKLPVTEKTKQKDLKEADEETQKVLSSMASGFETGKVPEKLESAFDDPLWEAIHERCLGCAACSFVCPTCHCFDIQDENSHEQGRRVRLWDSCMFPLFTLHASGHNPRPCGKERMRQRIMHKFYYFKKNTGQIACVGCGRCIRECPVNVDIRQILSAYST